ncbi:UDP-N-acetylmuramoyl-L-alanine--D-glutamate ligase [Paenibacillus antri]|uniref:UDP-N-acetylmuramoylalanine--D-glutamate ligase n=1 Tax=Paenibacillus antri TaxID=2582848 RepID=A0A5R9G8H8_9BACL|nr:UDP-N-acetylmuramoyl-L-alanine--D-glutamate ligase [Paenibacillus antri]TLS50400.1 UDP-N-acetylmuramoyl-L-alanine--D-glutamate ligase [Paenibacillus antri]
MQHPDRYQGRRVVVLGLARSGVAVAELLHRRGADVVVNDKKERSSCPEADPLSALGISVVCGHHPDDLIDENVALVVKNPGIPYSIPPIRRALELGIEIVTEVEVADAVRRSPMIGITGSNGKTTTTTLVHLILKQDGQGAIVAGNIGRALTEAALEARPDEWLVTELSSFQLKGTVGFRPNIACLLNLYETHLDYHGTMDDYAASKAKLFANQTADDTAVFNWDDPFCRSLAPRLSARPFPFSSKEPLEQGVYIQNGVIRVADGNREPEELMPVREIAVRGGHNAENAIAAAAVALSAGASPESVRTVLRTFRGVEHRLEFVLEKDGIAYYNDSKATNPTATSKSIESFDGGDIVLVCGGLDRGSDYMELLPVFERSVKAVVALGEAREKLLRVAELAGVAKRTAVDAADPEEAVRLAAEAARGFAEPGQTVLLSPACASWDMFPSYEDRGRMFKHSVHTL